ncbi:MAG: TauD/TfdA family dioxygenase [Proteobacteria bacterium]|nr:TauD/TfdA family dioxygenase [Pseudomonadota bacterium]
MRHHSKIITDASAWTRDSLLGTDDWIIQLEDVHRRELEAALVRWRRQGGLLHQANPESFPLPSWQSVIATAKQSMLSIGLALIRGFPIDNHSDDGCAGMYWGLGTHLGVAVTQTNTGDLLMPVYDRKFRGETTAKSFGYASDQELEFHVDPTDTAGLLCIRKAKHGGETCLASATSIHNEMLKSRPDLLEALYDGFVWMRRYPGGGRVSAPIPVFASSNGKVLSRFHRRYIDTGAEVAGVAPTSLQCDALDYFASLTTRRDLTAEVVLQPGDLILLNNYLVVHAKKAQCDEGDPQKGRLLQRLWLYMHEFQENDPKLRQEPGRYGVIGLSSAEWWAGRRPPGCGLRWDCPLTRPTPRLRQIGRSLSSPVRKPGDDRRQSLQRQVLIRWDYRGSIEDVRAK